jgi:hypothetical protein
MTIFCQVYIGDANRKPTKKFISKGESTMEYNLDIITKG